MKFKLQKTIPAFKYPTTIVLVDDDIELLSGISQHLVAQYKVKAFHNPLEAREHIATYYKTTLNDAKYIKVVPPDSPSELAISIDLRELHQEIDNEKKYNDISTLIVDYDMPGVNGIELCKMIKNSQIIKILLSGNIEDKTVIESFNNGIIDGFISKGSNNLLGKIDDSIKMSETAYFAHLSSVITQCIKLDRHSVPYLDSLQFIRFFMRWIEDHNIVEYYLVNNEGQFIMKDNKNDIYKLYTANDDGIKAALEILPDSLDSKTIKKLESREIMLCLSDEELTESNVRNSLKRCDKIPGQEDIYFAFIKIN